MLPGTFALLAVLYRTKQRRKAGRGTGYEASVQGYIFFLGAGTRLLGLIAVSYGYTELAE